MAFDCADAVDDEVEAEADAVEPEEDVLDADAEGDEPLP